MGAAIRESPARDGSHPSYSPGLEGIIAGESALCLAYDDIPKQGGVLTPSVALNGALLSRLRAAGLTFEPAER